MKNKSRQYIYVLKVLPRYLNPSNWTETENKILDDHFSELKKLMENGKLILAGKTQGLDEKTFGIVIIETETEEEATRIMQNDPAVSGGIMKAELFPYQIALFRRK
jgi:uncharacterized protein YciI